MAEPVFGNSTMEQRAKRQWEAAKWCREFVKTWRAEPCACPHHSDFTCVRQQISKIANENPSPLITDAMLWIAYRHELKRVGEWP